jgi:hypothetical protein
MPSRLGLPSDELLQRAARFRASIQERPQLLGVIGRAGDEGPTGSFSDAADRRTIQHKNPYLPGAFCAGLFSGR